MAHEIIMPALGMAQETGRLVAWLKNEGDAVSKGDPLMEVETDKSTMEVEAQKDGFLVNITAQANTDVPVGDVVALIVESLDDAPPRPSPSSPSPEATETAATTSDIVPKTPSLPAEQSASLPKIQANEKIARKPVQPALVSNQADGKILASPKLRALAASENLDLSNLRNAGHPEPFKAADLFALRQLSNQSHGSLRSTATSLIEKNSFHIFVSEISAFNTEVSIEVIFASFIAASLRQYSGDDIIGISYKSGKMLESVLYLNPDQHQLADIVVSDSDIPVMAEICDLTSTDFIHLSGDTHSDIIFTISNLADQFMITLDWQPNKLPQSDALALLSDFSMRVKSPLKQLL